VDFVAADAGSTDAGPGYLGAGEGMVYRDGLLQALDYILALTLPRKIPFLVGSANVGGTREGVNFFREIIEEIGRKRRVQFRAAFIYSEMDEPYLKQRLADGKIRPLDGRPSLVEKEIDQASHIVGLMGTEPSVEALEQGAAVIVGGRTTDPALFAAVPIWRGIPLNVASHMGKVLDHGSVNLDLQPGANSWVRGVAASDHFRIEATNPRGRCSALKVARATLHENVSPVTFYEPPGRIDVDGCEYVQLDPRTVKVTGTRFTPLPYSIKLEGAKCVGFRTITICGYRNPAVTRTRGDKLELALDNIQRGAKAHGIATSDFQVHFHSYGCGEILREWEPETGPPPMEVGVVADCVAESADMSKCIAAMAHWELHMLRPDALLFSPSDIGTGPVYEFNVWNLLEPNDPLEFSRTEIMDVY
jgi:hypothetical protein